MRKLGMDVDLSIAPRTSRKLVQGVYRDKFCDDIRSATPRSGWHSWSASQNIADSPHADEESPMQNAEEVTLYPCVVPTHK